jgi:hypothetical protein
MAPFGSSGLELVFDLSAVLEETRFCGFDFGEIG